MRTGQEKRKRLAQNFFHDPKTVRKLVKMANFSKSDFVLEVGPGNGVITEALAAVAGRVLAVEVDRQLLPPLREKFADVAGVEIVEGDFLTYDLPVERCALFANIPFNLTAPIMQKLYFADSPPDPVYFVMQKEAAEKFVGTAESTESAILYQPFFHFDYLTDISRFAFRPVPSIDAALLGLRRRDDARLQPDAKIAYFRFVTYGFRQWKKSLKLTFKPVFTYPQWKRLARENRFPIDAQPGSLSLDQWLALFRFFQTGVAPDKQRPVLAFDPEKGLGAQKKRSR